MYYYCYRPKFKLVEHEINSDGSLEFGFKKNLFTDKI